MMDKVQQITDYNAPSSETFRLHQDIPLSNITSLKIAVFWDVTPRSLVDIDQHFSGAYSHQQQGHD
jgi:hypothetical protein